MGLGKGLAGIPLEEWHALAKIARYNANEFARQLHLSTRQLQRVCRLRVGRSPQEWLNEQRIASAKDLLLSGNLSVREVAFGLGFKEVSHFCRQFKLRSHSTPSEFASAKFSSLVSLTDN